MKEMEERRRPLEPTNSRFAAAAEADRSHRDDRGPPPVAQNSRFAAAAEADRSLQPRGDDRGPPPVPQNSRFAAAAEADRDYGASRSPRGPPPAPQNSRFAAAAAEAEREAMEREDRYRERNDFYGRDGGGGGGPPPPQNSRFAAAVAADEDYVPEERRRRGGPDDRYDDRGDRGGYNDRFGDRGGGGYNDRPRGGGGYGGDRRGYDDRGGRFNRYDDRYEDRRGADDRAPPLDRQEVRRGRVDDILKPKERADTSNMLVPPPKAPEHAANMFVPPAPKAREHADNMLVPPAPKAREHADNMLVPPKKKEEPEKAEEKGKAAEAAAPSTPAANVEELLNEFVSGDKLGDDLKAWVEEKRAQIPTVEKLIFHLLSEKELKNPDPECGWAEPSKYGAALQALVEDDIAGQMQVLWAIQKVSKPCPRTESLTFRTLTCRLHYQYCDKLGFPKLNDEYLVQSMFRSMYKYDLSESDAFTEWKEDESSEHETGKLKAVIQTVEWFNWLEEDDDDDDDEYEDEEEAGEEY